MGLHQRTLAEQRCHPSRTSVSTPQPADSGWRGAAEGWPLVARAEECLPGLGRGVTVVGTPVYITHERPSSTARDNRSVPAAEVRTVTTVDDALRKDLLACWVDVTNAGGAVGFVPPVTEGNVAPVLDKTLDGVAAGRDVVAVLQVDGEVAGFAVLVGSWSPLRRHWATVMRVQVHPSRQGTGLGGVLMRGVHDIARSRGLEFLYLGVRGGTGTEGFYRRLGYEEVGRVAGAIRMAPGDDREEILLVHRL